MVTVSSVESSESSAHSVTATSILTFLMICKIQYCGYPDKMPQDKMPQCQKRTKCHNVDGEIRMQK